MPVLRLLIVLCVGLIAALPGAAQQGRVLVQSTTSTLNSGLYDHLLPQVERDTGLQVAVVAVGTGQAINNARNGDADVLLVHDRAAEEAFVAEGHGIARHDLMYNDFVIIGPAEDPAGLGAADSLADALRRLATGAARFVSRGDDSGTHRRERALWAAAGLTEAAVPSAWYYEVGAGMGATLRVAVELGGYALTDRATWIAYAGKRTHRVLFEGDEALFNQYGIIAVNPDKHAHVNARGAQAFIDWMLSEKGQAQIAAFRVNGQQVFFPNARR